MVTVKVPENRESEMLNDFFVKSELTFEGLDISKKSAVRKLEEFLRKFGYDEKNSYLYYFTGSVMNKVFGLTGTNAYQDDFTFVVIPNFRNVHCKFAASAKWFDDIVQRNVYAQHDMELIND